VIPPLPPSLDALADQPSIAPRGVIARGRALGLSAAMLAATGAATVAWGQVERRLPAVRHVHVPVEASRGTQELRILQISDLHLYPGQEFLVDFLTRVARTQPIDMVLSTGDNFGSADGLPLVRAAHAPFLGLPGAFVLGSNDYYSPRHKNWAHYLRRDPRVSGDPRLGLWTGSEDEFGTPSRGLPHSLDLGHDDQIPDLPWRAFVADLDAAGWADLSNRAATLDIATQGGDGVQRVSLIGVDDPHLGRDRLPAPDASWTDPRALRLAVTHAPYVRVVDAFTHRHPDVIVAGHTHGGQIALPFLGAIVTNCDLPRRFARGLHMWTAGDDAALLQVSAGLGTSPFAPVRVAARPEVTVIHLMPV
jgi:predicted MPP superfamily phosphohydrolase